MPLAKGKPKSGKKNQGAQWGDTGSPGNIHRVPEDGGTDKSRLKPANSSKKGRDLATGRHPGTIRKSFNPE